MTRSGTCAPEGYQAEFLDGRLSASRVVMLDTGHFAWEEAPAEGGAITLDSITAN